MNFDEAVELAREVMARPGWHVSRIWHWGRQRHWLLTVRQTKGNMSEYRVGDRLRWTHLYTRLEAARKEDTI